MTAHSREDEKPSCIPPTWTSVPTCTLAPPSATGCSRQHRSFPAVQSSKPACITSSPRLRLPPSTVLCPFRRHSTVSSCVASQRIPKQGRPPHSNSRAYSKPSTRRCGSGSKGKPGGVTALRACSPLSRKPAAPLAPRGPIPSPWISSDVLRGRRVVGASRARNERATTRLSAG